MSMAFLGYIHVPVVYWSNRDGIMDANGSINVVHNSIEVSSLVELKQALHCL